MALSQQGRLLPMPEDPEDFPSAGKPFGAAVIKPGGNQGGHPLGREVVLRVHGDANRLHRHMLCLQVPRVAVNVGDAGIGRAKVNSKV